MEIVYGSIWFCEFMNIMNKSGRFNNDSGCYIKNVGEAFTRLLRSSYSRSFAGGAQQQQGRASWASAAGRCSIPTLFT